MISWEEREDKVSRKIKRVIEKKKTLFDGMFYILYVRFKVILNFWEKIVENFVVVMALLH